jgi:hypothetical protein
MPPPLLCSSTLDDIKEAKRGWGGERGVSEGLRDKYDHLWAPWRTGGRTAEWRGSTASSSSKEPA